MTRDNLIINCDCKPSDQYQLIKSTSNVWIHVDDQKSGLNVKYLGWHQFYLFIFSVIALGARSGYGLKITRLVFCQAHKKVCKCGQESTQGTKFGPADEQLLMVIVLLPQNVDHILSTKQIEEMAAAIIISTHISAGSCSLLLCCFFLNNLYLTRDVRRIDIQIWMEVY